MSFDKRYPKRKDWRKPYYRGGAVDRTCRPHGGCQYCADNRTHRERVALASAQDKLKESVQYVTLRESHDQ